jgi:hypothetical protein
MIIFNQAIEAAQNLAAKIFDPSDLKGLRFEANSLSDDHPLYISTSNAGRDAINFTHLRHARGTL